MKYLAIFQTAWSYVWRTRILWWLGLLAAIGGGGFNYVWSAGELQPTFELPMGTRVLLRQILSAPNDAQTLVIIALSLGLIMFLLHTLAEGAMIHLVDRMERHQVTDLRDSLRSAAQQFAPLVVARAILAVPVLIVAILTNGLWLPALANFFTAPLGNRLFEFGMIARFAEGSSAVILIGLLVAALSLGTTRAIMIDRLAVGPAILHATRLFLTKIFDFIIVTLLFVAIGIVVGIAYGIILAPILFISILPSITGKVLTSTVLTLDATSLGPVAFIAIALTIIFGMLVTAYASTVWTLTYREWHSVTRRVFDAETVQA